MLTCHVSHRCWRGASPPGPLGPRTHRRGPGEAQRAGTPAPTGCRRSGRRSDTLNRLRSLGGLECETGPSGFRLAGRGSGLANLESGVTPCPRAPPTWCRGPKGPAPGTAGGPARILPQTGLGLSLETRGSRKEGPGPVSRLPAAPGPSKAVLLRCVAWHLLRLRVAPECLRAPPPLSCKDARQRSA